MENFNCFTPPFVLRSIIANGTPLQRTQAERALQLGEALREQRRAITHGPEEVEVPQAEGKYRLVYSAQNRTALPGVLVREEGENPTNDPAVDEAYNGAGITYDLFQMAYGRNSIDGQGLRLVSTVHYDRSFDNAFWNGEQMVYGDGDEDLPPDQALFNRFTIAVDIIAHELTHGVVQFSANLNYSFQPGALNESMADVFGVLAKQWSLGQAAGQADWIVGAGLFTPNVNAVGLRSMKAPGTAYDDPVIGRDPQPGHMRDYVYTNEDNGGVHINSGIPNRAFYVTAVELGGFAWEKAGLIWYRTLVERLNRSSDFQAAANATYTVAGELYGAGSREQQAVRAGWAEVGLNVEGAGTPPDGDPPPQEESPGCLAALIRTLLPFLDRA